MNVFVLAAGDATRWQNYLGTPKHLIKIDDEILLHRTCRQFLAHSDNVTVVVKEDDRHLYGVDGAGFFSPPFDLLWGDFAKLKCTEELWDESRTVLVFGDVWFTDEAVRTIMTDASPITFFLRPNRSELIGGRPEVFAIAFDANKRQTISDALAHLIKFKIPPPAGIRTYRHLVRPFYTANDMHVIIDDLTTDFDYPEDYDNWMAGREKFLRSVDDNSHG